MNKSILAILIVAVLGVGGYVVWDRQQAAKEAAAAEAAAVAAAEAAAEAARKAEEEAAAKAAEEAAALKAAEEAAAKAAEEAAAKAAEALEQVQEQVEGAVEGATEAVEGAVEQAQDAMSNAADALTVDGFDADKAAQMIEESSLNPAMKTVLNGALEAAKNDPALLDGALAQIRQALGLE